MKRARLLSVMFVGRCAQSFLLPTPQSFSVLPKASLLHEGSRHRDVSVSVSKNLVFCNRELTLDRTEAIGFDMDYTLAQYKPEFDLLAYDGSASKLAAMGYPREIISMSYQPDRFSRGLVLDIKLGNILKMDRYKYVRVAQHGSRRLGPGERRAVYRDSVETQPTYTGREYINVDTQFQIVDAQLFEQLVDLKDEYAVKRADPAWVGAASEAELAAADFIARKSYEQLFVDLRKCVDLCHRDGVIKDRVAEDPARYIVEDPNLFPMLEQFRLAGKKVFLLTNSYYDYTDTVMTFLLASHIAATEGRSHSEATREGYAWAKRFDVVIVGSCKPAFMQDRYLSLFRVVPQMTDEECGLAAAENVAEAGGPGSCGRDYTLRNTDGLGGLTPSEYLRAGHVFQGGNWLHLQQLLGLSRGDKLLYVGDHTYSDVLRSKRTLGWRTCLVVPELEAEMASHAAEVTARKKRELEQLRLKQEAADDKVDSLALQVYRAEMRSDAKSGAGSESGDEAADEAREALAEALVDGLEHQALVKAEVRSATEGWHACFPGKWGQIFKAGLMDSRFAKQVSDYACVYVSRASDLGTVSPTRGFRAQTDLMPHEHREPNPDHLGPI